VGKGCHANDEREALMHLAASAHHVPARSTRQISPSHTHTLSPSLSMAGGREDEGVAADARAARRARHDQDPGIELGLVRWADRIPFCFLPSFFLPFP
jgi:hypothetical protein